MEYRCLILGMAIVMLFVPGPADGSEWEGSVERKGDVPYVSNPSQGFNPRVVVRCVESWRHGGTSSNLLLGSISETLRDEEGRSFLLDSQMNVVHVIGPKGSLQGSIGREGEGPGEFRRASGAALQSDGVVCVSQVMPARLARVARDGSALDDHPLPRDFDANWLNGCAATDAGLVVFLDAMIQEGTRVGMQTLVALLASDGSIAGECWRRTLTADMANMEFDERTDAPPVRAVGNDGRFYVSTDWDSYEVGVMECGAGDVMTIAREYEHLLRPSAEIAEVEKQKPEGRISSETRVATTLRDIMALFPRPDGSLWVLSSRGERAPAEGLIAVFDEFDRDGRFVREVALSGTYRPGLDSFALAGSHIYIFPESDEENEVICMGLELPE